MKTYEEVIDYLFSALPMYQRIGAAAYKTDITNTVKLMDALGNPHNSFKTIHVAGTNGKGSVSHLLASILQKSGLKVGLYTSPHLLDFRERIRINGQMIPKENVVQFVENHQDTLNEIQPSFFEMTVGMAFEYFANEKIDIAVVEVGMGGRLDSTNIISPDLSVITNIGFDHTQFLGNTLEAIAGEKAGIIKPSTPVVVGETQTETSSVFLEKARKENAPITFADQEFKLTNIVETADSLIVDIVSKDGNIVYKSLKSALTGAYQQKNIITVIEAVKWLQKLNYQISTENIYDAFENVISLTGFMGRWQVISKNPLVVCETAHNKDGISYLHQKLKTLNFNKLHIIYGCVNDKDYDTIMDLMPKDATYYFCKPSVPRGLDVEVMRKAATKHGLIGVAYSSISEALQSAKNQANNDDLILVTGSIFLVADALREFKEMR